MLKCSSSRVWAKRLMAVVLVSLVGLAAWADSAKKVLVLGVDGMDPRLFQKFIGEGGMANFKRLMDEGDFSILQTSMPPQSPVAWSTFITGMDPGGHGIFDFVHRKPETLLPYLSMSEALPPERTLKFGSWVLPLSGGDVNMLRKGKAFWQMLDEAGVPATIFRMPVNFPPVDFTGRSLSGMGTPDLLGTSGTFQYFSNVLPRDWKDIGGGEISEIPQSQVQEGVITATIIGPPNSFRRVPKKGQSEDAVDLKYETPSTEVEFTVYLDRENETAKIVVQDTEIVLQEGEWSDWFRIDFEMIPYLVSANGIARFYLKQVHPNFKLYLTPLQINPADPAMPISTPDNWSEELVEELGFFYTQELPEDTKAFSGGILTAQEFWEQAQFVYRERRRALDYFIDNFEEGFLFFYFSSLDQNSHMLWHFMDDKHPFHDTEQGLPAESLKTVYEEIDESLGYVLNSIDEDTTLIVMSDHGFAPFYWGVNLNSWLVKKGYIELKDPNKQGQVPFFGNVDWTQTRAYALGLNGLYVNLAGRETEGIVQPGGAYQGVLDNLEIDLLAMKDPRNGNNPVSLVVQTHRDFNGPHCDIGPDIIVGYNWGYRTTAESGLGEFPRELFVDNLDEWSADHSVDHRLVPGVLFTNKKITLDNPALYDLTVTVLDEYGIAPLPEMIGKDCIASE